MGKARPVRPAPPLIRFLGADGIVDVLLQPRLLFDLAYRRVAPRDILRLSMPFGEAPVSGAEILDEKDLFAIHDLDAGAAEGFCCEAEKKEHKHLLWCWRCFLDLVRVKLI